MLSKIKVIFLISLLYPGICTAQDDPKQCLDVRNISPSELPFHAGEKLTIVASYKWGVVNTDVGTITLSLSDGINGSQPQFTARARIQTARFFNTFFKHYNLVAKSKLISIRKEMYRVLLLII